MAPSSEDLKQLAVQLRADSIRCTTAAGSGHPTSSLSAADLMAVLLAENFHYDFGDPHNLRNDRLIFSKGHASPLLYALFKAAGAITDDELLTLRKKGSRLEGHPTPALPWVDIASGSLGQGLSAGVGMALSGKYLDHLPFKVWVLLGDSEMAEGSVWEAFELASQYKLNNLIAILDMNRLGQRGPTMLEWHGDKYAERAHAFGWQPIQIDGHDLAAIDAAYNEAEQVTSGPVCIIARTLKGAGVSFLANQEHWHGKALSPEEAKRALAELGNPAGNLVVKPQSPRESTPVPLEFPSEVRLPPYQLGAKIATREAYGDALTAAGASNANVVALDGEVSNSTYSEKFKKAFPDRFFEMFIAEQNMVGAAAGLQALGKIPFASTFAAFFSRACDQIRMAAVSRANIRLVGSHAGVSIGEDGPSQMGLEDLSMMRFVHGSTVLYPCCATATAKLVEEMVALPGVSYLRTTREKTPVLYGPAERFPIGGSKILRQSACDVAAVIAAGITVHEALRAYEMLKDADIDIRVIDMYSIKPIDGVTLAVAARQCGGNLIVVEDHWPEGGLGSAVLEALTAAGVQAHVEHLAVRHMPASASPAQQLELAGISAAHIAQAARVAKERSQSVPAQSAV